MDIQQIAAGGDWVAVYLAAKGAERDYSLPVVVFALSVSGTGEPSFGGLVQSPAGSDGFVSASAVPGFAGYARASGRIEKQLKALDDRLQELIRIAKLCLKQSK